MFGSTTNSQGANAYAKVDMETGVAAADPHKLILMLFEGALMAVSAAKQHMQTGDIQQKGLAISKAIMIIDNGLRASLNKDAGGNIAENLEALYGYMTNKLLMGNLKNQSEMLDEVHNLLMELKAGWVMIGKNATPARTENEGTAPQSTSGYNGQPPLSSQSLANV